MKETIRIEDVFNKPNDIYSIDFQECLQELNDKDKYRYRTKTIKSGKMLEVEIYPLWNVAKKSLDIKEIKRQINLDAVNHRNRQKKMVRLLNSNFTSDDIFITLTYRNKERPETVEQTKKDVVNYIRRLKRYAKAQGWEELKYVYVIEESKTGKMHSHIVTNFKDRDIAEKKWTLGEYPYTRRLQPNDYEFEGLARYLSKDNTFETKKSKRYGYSLNLEKSWLKARTNDTKVTKTKARHIASGYIKPSDFFEKQYEKYTFIDIEIKQSDFVSGYYIYARMRQKDKQKLVFKRE